MCWDLVIETRIEDRVVVLLKSFEIKIVLFYLLGLRGSCVVRRMRQSTSPGRSVSSQWPDITPASIDHMKVPLDGLVPVHFRSASPPPSQRVPPQDLRGSREQWPSQFMRRPQIVLDTGVSCDCFLTSSLRTKSFHLMLKIFLRHLESKASSFFSWLDFKCQVSQP